MIYWICLGISVAVLIAWAVTAIVVKRQGK